MYKFNVFITTTNGDTTTTVAKKLLAESKKAAYDKLHTKYPNACIRVCWATTHNGIDGQVLPNEVGIALEALKIVRGVTGRLVDTSQQEDWRWRAFKRARSAKVNTLIKTLGNSAQVVNAVDRHSLGADEWLASSALINTQYLCSSADGSDTLGYLEDFHEEARLAILQAIGLGESSLMQVKLAYRFVNAYVRSWNAVDAVNDSLDEYTESDDGEIIKVRKDLNDTMFTDYFAYSFESMQDELEKEEREYRKVVRIANAILTGEKLGRALDFLSQEHDRVKVRVCVRLASANLTDTRKRIWVLTALGYSQREIAARLNREKKTIADHIAVIRQRIVETFETYGFGDVLAKWCPSVNDFCKIIAKGIVANHTKKSK